MKKWEKSIVLMLIVVASFTTGAVASGTVKKITATLDSAIKIVYNGEKQVMKDAKGVNVYPITYNGTTYVPVRAISNIFNQSVDWDGATKTIYLGSKEVKPTNLIDTMCPGNKYCWKIADKSELTVEGSDANATFSSGLIRDIWNGTCSTSDYNLVMHKVPAGAKTLSFTVWSDILANISVRDKDDNIIYKFEVPAEGIVSKEIDITGYTEIAFGADATKGAAKGIVKIFDPIVE